MLDGATDTDGAIAVPVSVTVWGLCGLVALSVMDKVAVRVPTAAGENAALIVQLAPAATLPSQLSLSAKSEPFTPPITMLEIVRVMVPVLLNVICCTALVVPTV